MNKLRVLDLFSGIGGFSLGLERTGGFETVAFCEIEPYARAVLAKHWPNVPCYDDVRTLTRERLAADGISVDVICGGFPCQDISEAGDQAGLDGERSGLWAELRRIIDDLRPQIAIVENVSALLTGNRGGWFGRVLGELAEIGYDAEWHCVGAAHLGAPHIRDRIWIIAYPDRQGQHDGPFHAEMAGLSKALAHSVCARQPKRQRENTERTRQEEWTDIAGESWWAAEPDVGRVADGIPNRVDRLKGLGNAVVPKMPFLIGKAILESMRDAA